MSKESMLTSGIVVSIAMIVLFVVGSVMRSQIEASIGADAYQFYYVAASVAAAIIVPIWMMIATRGDDDFRDDGSMCP
jgi:hypothetical protein